MFLHARHSRREFAGESSLSKRCAKARPIPLETNKNTNKYGHAVDMAHELAPVITATDSILDEDQVLWACPTHHPAWRHTMCDLSEGELISSEGSDKEATQLAKRPRTGTDDTESTAGNVKEEEAEAVSQEMEDVTDEGGWKMVEKGPRKRETFEGAHLSQKKKKKRRGKISSNQTYFGISCKVMLVSTRPGHVLVK